MKHPSKRLSILSQPEIRAIYSVPQLSAREREHFFSFTDEELVAAKGLHNSRNRIHFLLILGYFKIKRVSLVYQWKDIEADYLYIQQRYYPKASKKKQNISRFTRSRLYRRLFELFNYQRCDKANEKNLVRHLMQRAKYYIDEVELFQDAVNFLKSEQLVIPRYTTMQDIISHAINTEETRLSKLVEQHPASKAPFLDLISTDSKKFRLGALKKLAKAYKTGENKQEISRHEVLSALYADANSMIEKIQLSEGNIRYFATRCLHYDISELRDFKKAKAIIYLACFVVTRFRISNDILTLSFLVSHKDISDQAKSYREECAKQQAMLITEYVEHVPLLLDIFVDDNIQNDTCFGAVRQQAFDILSEEKIPLVSQKLASIKPDTTQFTWEYIDKNFGQVTKNLRPLFIALAMGCRDNAVLHKQIEMARILLTEKPAAMELDGRLIKKRDKIYLTVDNTEDELQQATIAKRQEMYLYQLLYQGIRNGSVYVKNSLEYRSFDDYLVNDAIWQQRDKYLKDVGLDWMIEGDSDPIDSLRQQFEDKLAAVTHRIVEGHNSFMRRKPKTDDIHWSRAVNAKDSELTEKFFDHFDRKSIVNVIRKVNNETGFLACLKPKSMRYKKSTIDIENLLACLIGNGTFQGIYKFSDLSDQQYKVLKRIEEDCFHDEALSKAIDTVTSRATQLTIYDDFKLSDGQFHSSADGQRFESKHSNPLVDHSAKHFGKKKGGIVYTLAASHFAVRGNVISARSHESHHLFDLVYNNKSDLKATMVSTDTHGTNQFNHAILNAFGYHFTPRYAKFKNRFLAEFSVNFKSENALSLTKRINWNLIRAEWENIVKILLSLGLRTVQQSTLVKKLCSFKQHSSTLLAFAEYNRVYKCLHLLEYADDQQLRQVIQESLNRGEQLQGLKRALVALGGNQFRGSSPEEMVRWNQCADLLANCIVYYNAWIMSSFKTYCLKTGNGKQLKHLKTISPASWEHILLNGRYDLAENDDAWDIESELRQVRLTG